MSNVTFNDILSGLQGVKRSGDGHTARCPAHDDKHSSLSIRQEGGKVLLHCFAGCSVNAICGALGIELRDLFSDDVVTFNTNTSWRVKEAYVYADANGEVLYENCRLYPLPDEPKPFRPRRYVNGRPVWNLDGVERVPFRLPELIAERKLGITELILTEGEKDTNNVVTLGLCASNFKNWRRDFNVYIDGLHVTLIRDHDVSGVKQADDAAAIMSEKAASVRILDVYEGTDLPDSHGRDVSDWIEQQRSAGLDDEQISESLGKLAAAAPLFERPVIQIPSGLTVGLNPAARSLISLNSPPVSVERPEPVLDEKALHGPAGEAVRIILPHTEAAAAPILIQLLAGFGILIGPTANFSFGRDRHFTRINAVIVGLSGVGRKGTSWSEAKNVLTRVDQGFNSILNKGLSSGEGLINHVRDASYKKEPIKDGDGRIVDYQEVLDDPGVDDKRLFVHESEFSRVLKAAAREGNPLSEIIREAFDTGDLRVMTKNRVTATGAHIGIVGHITGYELLRTMDETDKANGFGNRILWVYAKRSQLLPLGGEPDEASLNHVVGDLRAAQEFAATIGELKRSQGATDLWMEVYGSLTSENHGMLDALTSRGTAHIMRLATLYAVLSRSPVIDVDHLEAAIAMWHYSLDSARYIFGDGLGDKVADSIVAALSDAPEGLTRTELSNALGRHFKADALNAATGRLERLGLVSSRREPTSGKTRTVLFLTAKKAK